MAVDHNNPQSRDEEILIATIDGTEYDKIPQSRIEELLLELKEVIEEGGGGGTTDYENLSNQPQINGETLIGDKLGADLGLVDAEEGKGLSTNDYDDTEKAAVAAATSAISAMKDGSDIDSFGDVEVALLDKADISDLGTAAAKNSTNAVTSGSTDLVESGAVKDAIDAAVSSAYHHAGTKTVAQLTHDLLIAANEGNVYNITDSGTTTSDFIEGIGKTIDEGSNVGICKVGNVYMFDLLSGFVDTTNFVQKSQTSGILKNDGTVNTTIENAVDANTNAIIGIKDGQSIDSFGDVEDWTSASTKSVTGNPITISDAAAVKAKALSVSIEPVQDLHGYDHPWVGGAGNNVMPTITPGTYTQSGITAVVDSNGLITVTGKNTGTNDVSIFMPLVTSFGGKVNQYLHLRNSISNSSIAFNIGGLAPTLAPINNIVAYNSDKPESSTCNIFISHIITSDLNFSLQPSVETTDSVTDWSPYTNVCPISGHTEASVTRVGKNLFDVSTVELHKSINNDGLVYPTENYNLSDYIRVSGTKLIVSGDNKDKNISFGFYDKNKNWFNFASSVSVNTAVTIPNGTAYVRFDVYKDSENIQLELGETATPYEPYAGKIYTISLGSTIYGGTVDFDSGVMTVTDVITTINDLSWIYDSQYNRFYSTEIEDMQVSTGRNLCVYSSSYECKWHNEEFDIDWDGVIYNGHLNNKGHVLIHDHRYTDVSLFKTDMANSQIVYPLATPLTVQLTPQQIQLLKGQNTLTANGSTISLTYQPDNLVGEVMEQVEPQIEDLQGQVNEIAEDVAELQTGLTKLHYHKVAESAVTGTRADKLASLYTTYNTLPNDVRKSAILLRNNADIFHAVNNSGTFSNVYVDITTLLFMCVGLNPGSYVINNNGTATDGSSTENAEVYSLWIIE